MGVGAPEADAPRSRLRDVPVEGPTVRDQGRAMAQAICSPFGSPDGRTFPELTFSDDGQPRPSIEPPSKRRRLMEMIEQYLPRHDPGVAHDRGKR